MKARARCEQNCSQNVDDSSVTTSVLVAHQTERNFLLDEPKKKKFLISI